MKTKFQKGDSMIDGLLALAIVGFIIVAFIVPGKSPRPLIDSDSTSSYNYNSNSTYNSPSDIQLEKTSSYSSSISIGSGNASYAYQPYEEYITIDNRSRNDINITGWTLANNKSARTYDQGGQLQRFSSDTVRIPTASLYIPTSGIGPIRDVVLASGDKAIITTGAMGQRAPYAITSFKENICSGYLDASDDYTFTPALSRNCPRPINELGVGNLDVKCQDFIKSRIQSCQTPELDRATESNDYCSNCIDRVQLSSSCVAFIKEHYSYQGCIAYHSGDENFYGNTWRIFLDHDWELWANDHDVIKLLDASGNLVDYRSY